MLRGVGVLLVLLSMLSAAASLLELFESHYWGSVLGWLFTVAYCSFGIAAGIVLIGVRPIKRGSLFWIAVFGAILCVALVVVQSISFLHETFVWRGRSLLDFVFSFFGPNIWWPPKSDGLFYWIWGPSYQDGITGTLHRTADTWFVWVVTPLSLCLWAIWGRQSWLDRGLAAFSFLLAVWTTACAVNVAFAHYEIAMYHASWKVDEPLSHFPYYPEFSWHASYAVMILWFLAVAVLLFQRGSKLEKGQAANGAKSA